MNNEIRPRDNRKDDRGEATIASFPLTQLALRKVKWVYLLLMVTIIAGILSYDSLPKEWTPDIQIPLLIVVTVFPKSSPEDVEKLVTNPLEKELKGITDLTELKSTSSEGVSIITLQFDIGIDITEARTKVKNALDNARPKLPGEAEYPSINEINLSESPIMVVVLSGKMGQNDMTELADDIVEEVASVPGVLEAQRIGGSEKEIQIYVNPEKLRYYNISLSTLGNAIRKENISLPLGNFDSGPMNIVVRSVGEIKEPKDLENIVIADRDSVPVYVKNVATVQFAEKETVSKSRLYRNSAISISVSKRAGENMQRVAKNIKTIIQKYEDRHDNGINLNFKIVSDQTVLVDANLSNLENNIYTGLLLVVATLMFFMGIRNAMFVGFAVPLSMLITFIVLSVIGISLNFIVLFGLILGLGMLVDNAVVIVENIYRHYQLGKSRTDATLQGVGEVAYPVIVSTLTTVSAFFPLIFMPGIMGEFIGYLPKTVIIMLLASLVVAILFNPIICATLMKKPKTIHSGNDEDFIRQSKTYRVYLMALGYCMKYWYLTFLGVAGSFFGIIIFYFTVINAGVEFFPQDEPSVANINISAPFGTNLEESNRIVKNIEKMLEPYDKYTDSIVSNIGGKTGSSAAGGGSGNSYITISFPTWEKRTKRPSLIIDEIREKLKQDKYKVAGAEVVIALQRSGPPGSRALEIEIRGQDLVRLKNISNQIKGKIFDQKGLVNLKDDLDISRAEVILLPDREKIVQAGLTLSDISGEIRSALSGSKVSTYRVDKNEYDIVVRYLEKYRKDLNNLETLTVYNQRGQAFSLLNLVRFKTKESYGSITHKEKRRTLTLSGDVEGVPSTTLVQGVKDIVEKMDIPKGYSVKFAGEETDRKEMQEFIMQAFLIAIGLIFLILVWDFQSFIKSFVILLTIPLSVMGVFFGLVVHQAPLSIIMSGIGFVSLAGVVVNNGIVMIDYIKYMRHKGHALKEAIMYTGAMRLRPIFLTSATTILGMMPMLFGMDINFYRFPNVVVFGAGTGAIWKPLSSAIAYGLLFSTLLTLFFIPTAYYTFVRFKAFVLKKNIERIHSDFG